VGKRALIGAAPLPVVAQTASAPKDLLPETAEFCTMTIDRFAVDLA
jgi:hypothetical protein